MVEFRVVGGELCSALYRNELRKVRTQTPPIYSLSEA